MSATPDKPTSQAKRLLAEFPKPTLDVWHQVVLRLLKGAPYEKRMLTHIGNGITIKPIYTAEDMEGLAHGASMPGEPPFVRGSSPLGLTQEGWGVAQELPFPLPIQFNEALRHDLERGQTAAVLVLDQASRHGIDPDGEAPGQVGRGGTSISSLADLAQALDGVDLTRFPLYLEAGPSSLPAAALLAAQLQQKGAPLELLQGSVGFDPLAALAEAGSRPMSLGTAYDELALLTRWAVEMAPKLKTVSADGVLYHEGGGSAVEELAFTLAAAVAHLRELEQRGLDLDTSAPRILFRFAVGADFFMELAKLRAARLIWARVVEACGGGESAMKITIHARTARRGKTAFDPQVNILRATTEAFSAVLGGCDSLHVSPFDEPLGLPGELSRRLARNTQIILREESRAGKVVDAAGGSWYAEKLTAELSGAAWALFQEVEALGGMAAALEAGMIQHRIAASAERRRQRLALRREVLVGLTSSPDAMETSPPSRLPDLGAVHRDRAREVDGQRKAAHCAGELEALRLLRQDPAADTNEVFKSAVAAALAGATLGGLVKAIRVGGNSDESSSEKSVEAIQPRRDAEPFEGLRRAVLEKREGGLISPQVFLACLGPPAAYMARLEFSRSFFQVAGFVVAGDQWFETAAESAAAALKSRAPVVCIVSTDESYAEAVPELTAALKGTTAVGRAEATTGAGSAPDRAVPGAGAGAAPEVILAGAPGEREQAFREAGVARFVHARSDLFAELTELAERMGVTR